jgi:hypothetical protein
VSLPDLKREKASKGVAVNPSISHEPGRQQLRDYLLGRMPEEAAAELDERLFDGNAALELLEEERQSLIEDFVGGRLYDEEAALFRSQMARSPELGRKVEDFRQFLLALKRETAFSEKRKTLSLVFLFLSPALALLLCVVSLFYVKERHKSADLRAALSAGPQATQVLSHPYPGDPSLATAFLSANVPRGSSGAPEILLPANASTLELQVELRNPLPDDKDWKVEVLAGNELLWQSAHTPVRRAGQETFLTVFVNAQTLPPGPYTIRYSPMANPEAIQTRRFVIRQSH